MYRIRTLNNISRKGLDCFPVERFELVAREAQVHALLLRSHRLDETALHDGLLAIGRAGAGVNNIPVHACSEKGIVVFNTPGANANAVKELVLTALLLSGRGVLDGIRFVDGLDPDLSQSELNGLVEKEKKRFRGHELQGRTLGVVGLGAVGSLVANTALDLGMHVMGYDPELSVEAAWRIRRDVERVENIQAVISRADMITLHVPALETTRNLINGDVLAQCKPGVTLLNFARKEVVHPGDLLSALRSGRVSNYISDFPVRELRGQPGVVAMPHLGASTIEAQEYCSIMVADQLVDFLLNGNIANSVNFPYARLERAAGHRLTFSNRNVPRVLGQVLSILAEHNINVLDMLNKSKADLAYNLIDMETEPDDRLLAEVSAIDGVIGVRRV